MFNMKETQSANLSEEEERFLSDHAAIPSAVEFKNDKIYLPRSKLQLKLLLLNVTLFVISLMVGSWSFLAIRAQSQRSNDILRKSSFYSPMFDKIDLDPRDVLVNGTLLDPDNSIWRAPPSPEVDEAWTHISQLMAHPITSGDIVKLGKDPSGVSQFPESMGLGDDAYAAEFDVFHKIHCLNGLRREVNFDYYFLDKYPDRKVPELHKLHTSHCIAYLLSGLMCDTNVDIITQVWAEYQIHPFPDFRINRRCRDFQALLDWQDANHVDAEQYKAMRKPENHIPYPMSDKFRDMFGADGDPAFGQQQGSS